MDLCEQCQRISSTVLVSGNNKVLHHTHETFQKSVFGEKCYLCSQVWNSLNEEQKTVASRPDFEGINYEVFFYGRGFRYDGQLDRILAKVDFTHGEDLWDCEEYDEVGGKTMEEAGQFAILNPYSE